MGANPACMITHKMFFAWILCGLTISLVLGQQSWQELCLATWYHINKELCCNGTIHNRYGQSGEELKCCGDYRPYYPSLETCCYPQLVNNQILKQRVGEHTICCGGEFHAVTKISKVNDCCNGLPFHNDTSICCHGNVNPRTPQTQCCGKEGKAYEKDVQRCLKNGTVVPISTRSFCNGPQHKTEYDPNKQICCFDTGIVLSLPMHGRLSSAEKPPNYRCERDTLIDLNKMAAKTCGEEQYIQDGNKLCCAGRLKTKKQEADASCCGQELIDNDEEVCCNDKILAKGYQCCHTTYDIPYKTDEQTCCLGYGLINKTTHLCCKKPNNQRVVVRKSRTNDTDCCALKPYNKYEQTCTSRGTLKLQVIMTIKEQFQTPKRGRTRKGVPCPFGNCQGLHTANTTCSKRFEFYVVIHKKKELSWGTRYEAIILKSDQRRKLLLTHVRVNVPAACPCIRLFQTFRIYTNRKIQKNGVLRLNNKDFLVHASANFQCEIKT